MPSIRLAAGDAINLPGTLFLNGNVYVTDLGTRASITGGGTVDLNGARFLTPDANTELTISTTIANGNFSKEGAGLLRLSGPAALTGPTRVTGGTLRFDLPASMSNGTVALSGGTLAMMFTLGGDHTTTANADVRLDGGAALTADETAPDEKYPGRIRLRKLFTASAAGMTLTVSSRSAVTASFGSAEFDAPVRLNLAGAAAEIAGTITGDSAAALFTKDGAGTLALSGAAANTYLGGTLVKGGGLVDLRKPAGLAAIPAALQVAGAGTRVRLGAGEQIADAAAVAVTDQGTLDLNGFDETVGSLAVSGNGRVVTGGGRLTVMKGLTLSSGGSLAVRGDAGGAAPAVGGRVPAGSAAIVVRGLELSGGGTLDVANDGLVVDYDAAAAGGSPLGGVRERIRAGYAGGAWTGAAGIVSSVARADVQAAVGYAGASEVLGPAGGAFLGAAAVDGSAVVVRYTLAGDATLDGVVDCEDLVRLAQIYNAAVSAGGASWWFDGDFTYDGVADFEDLVKLAQNYNGGLGGGVAGVAVPGAPAGFEADLAAAFASVPEPSAVGGVVMGVAGALGRRRRGA